MHIMILPNDFPSKPSIQFMILLYRYIHCNQIFTIRSDIISLIKKLYHCFIAIIVQAHQPLFPHLASATCPSLLSNGYKYRSSSVVLPFRPSNRRYLANAASPRHTDEHLGCARRRAARTPCAHRLGRRARPPPSRVAPRPHRRATPPSPDRRPPALPSLSPSGALGERKQRRKYREREKERRENERRKNRGEEKNRKREETPTSGPHVLLT